jgi:hypothetical protein
MGRFIREKPLRIQLLDPFDLEEKALKQDLRLLLVIMDDGDGGQQGVTGPITKLVGAQFDRWRISEEMAVCLRE